MKYQLPIEFFKDKWYIREDLYPEMFNINTRHVVNCNIMYSVRNCFDSKEDAREKCNAIRVLVGADKI